MKILKRTLYAVAVAVVLLGAMELCPYVPLAAEDTTPPAPPTNLRVIPGVVVTAAQVQPAAIIDWQIDASLSGGSVFLTRVESGEEEHFVSPTAMTGITFLRHRSGSALVWGFGLEGALLEDGRQDTPALAPGVTLRLGSASIHGYGGALYYPQDQRTSGIQGAVLVVGVSTEL